MKRIDNKGEGVLEVILFAGFLVFVILPVFAVVMSKSITYYKIKELTDIVDFANIESISKIQTQNLSEGNIVINTKEALLIYKETLYDCLSDIYSKEDIIVKEFEFIQDSFPITCTQSNVINNPCIHSISEFNEKPILFAELLGIDEYSITIHVDTEIPIDK